MNDHRLDRAKELYELATFGGDPDALAVGEDELDGLEADLMLARGRLLHARFLADHQENPQELSALKRAVQLYQRLGDVRGEAEARFWVGTLHQVVRGDGDAALPQLQRAYDLAVQVGDALTRSYAVRHLGFHAMEQGHFDLAGEQLEESLRLRRQLGFRSGVAAALLALAELSRRRGEPERAEALLGQAATEAEQCGARGVLRWIEAARAEFSAAE